MDACATGPLLEAQIRDGLRSRYFGQAMQCFATTDSTMDAAHRWAKAGAPTGALVIAESQRAGRGRLGRRWSSPAGQGIYASLILRPAVTLASLPPLTLAMAVGLAQAIEAAAELPVQIKWPNDLMLNDAKVGGLLTEHAAHDRLPYLVAGFGINVNSELSDLPPGATSLREVLGRPLPRAPFLQRILETLEVVHDQFVRQGCSSFEAEWRRRSFILGRRVTVVAHAREVEGQAIDIDATGALVVRQDTGLHERFTAADVVKLW